MAVSPALVFWILSGPLPQDRSYHLFADDRTLFGIPNFLDVASNLLFCAVGLWGLVLFLRNRARFPFGEAVLGFVVGVFLTGLGSAYFHWRPNNDTLVWDRLPMSVAFMSFAALIIFERISESWGRRLLMPLLVAGVGSILFWAWRDDLRIYTIVQFYPILALPIILLVTKGPGTRYYWLLLLCYVVAKILEALDIPIFNLLGTVCSGHTLKHVAAAAATLFMVLKFRNQARQLTRS
jgi:hypothetical protein